MFDGWYRLSEDGEIYQDGTTPEHEEKRVMSDDLEGFWVSTVFLGLDHGFGEGHESVLFETMVFPRDEDGDIDFGEAFCDRYCTLQEAQDGHRRVVQWMTENPGLAPPYGWDEEDEEDD